MSTESPPRFQRNRGLAGIIATAAIAISACGSSSGGESGEASPGDSPIAELLGFADFDPVESQRQQLEIEEAVASCMRQEGFEYVPVDYSAQLSELDVEDGVDQFADPVAYGKKYGYGVVRNYELYEEPYIGEDGSQGFPGDDFEDPNQEYVTSLSANESEAYYAALYGTQTFDDTEDDSSFDDGDGELVEEFIPPSLEEQGCSGSARLDIVGDDPLSDPEIQQALEETFADAQNDPALEQANQKWADCMVDPLRDFDMPDNMIVDTPDAMYQVLEAEKSEAAGQQVLPLDPETGEPIGLPDGEQNYGSTQNEDGTGFAFVGEPQAIPEGALEALRSLELSVWEDDFECQEESGVNDIQRDLEQRAADDLLAQFPDLAES